VTIGDWDHELTKVDKERLIDIQRSLISLREWPLFNKEFNWTRMFVLVDSIHFELQRRERELGKSEVIGLNP